MKLSISRTIFIILLFIFYSCNNKKNQVTSFLIFGDLHIGSENTDTIKIKKIPDLINIISPDYVFCTGDIIDGYENDSLTIMNQWNYYINTVSEYKNIFSIPGNHDIWDSLSNKIYDKIFENKYWIIENKNSIFIGLDVVTEDTIYQSEQLKWLEKKLIRINNRIPIIFTHYPLIEPQNSTQPIKINTELRIKLIEILKSFNIKYIVSGHEHIFTKVIQHPFVQYIVGSFSINMIKNNYNPLGNNFLLGNIKDDSLYISLIKSKEIIFEDNFPTEYKNDSTSELIVKKQGNTNYYLNNKLGINFSLPNDLKQSFQNEYENRVEYQYIFSDKKSSITIVVDEYPLGIEEGINEDFETVKSLFETKSIAIECKYKEEVYYKDGFDCCEWDISDENNTFRIKNFYIYRDGIIYCLLFSAENEYYDKNMDVFKTFLKSFNIK
ncbi:MAG: metallophosphoesterase family protein [Candidatus Thorarchaeota archaeon]